jgi:hypothetical protein
LLYDQTRNLQEKDIGWFSTNNEKFIKLNNGFFDIRTKTSPFDFQRLSDDLSVFMKTKLLNGVFKDLRGMYKFIIYMHKVYKVPFDQNAENNK